MAQVSEKAFVPPVSLREALKVWLYVAANSFGGPAGQIAVMHKTLVEDRRWISERRFLHALNYCMLLPGPEAQQLAVYLGWLLHRGLGGLLAGWLFVLPGFVAVLILSMLYAGWRDALLPAALLYGLKPAVLAVVVEAAVRMGRRALGNASLFAVAAGAFAAIFFFDVPFPVVVACAALIGGIGAYFHFDGFAPKGGKAEKDSGLIDALIDDGQLAHAAPSIWRAVRIAAFWIVLWWGPVAVLWALYGEGNLFVQLGLFFGKMAVVTFGGAYAVLAYVAQEAVHNFGWLTAGEMLDGLGMAETTPGPLIMVLEFVGFLAAYRAPGTLDPMLAGTLAALLVTWVTFAPCFMWIFLGAPYVERLRGVKPLQGALTAVTAAVVGVILNLALWFALHVLFQRVDAMNIGPLRLWAPDLPSLDGAALLLAGGALWAIFHLRLGMLTTLGLSAAAGAAWRLLF